MSKIDPVSNRMEAPVARAVDIELLAIDLSRCGRCLGTLENLEKAVAMVAPVLKAMDLRADVRKVVVASEAQALGYRFVSSPTVRVDGRDIVFETLEDRCDSCSDLCGCEEGTDCRIWSFRGKAYTEAPVGLLVEAILRAILTEQTGPRADISDYAGVPENLRRFFQGKARSGQSCCSSEERETCCLPTEKSACCGPSESESCGCR